MNRRGTILILVSGIAALLATLSLAFLARMRSDAEAGAELMQEVQSRLMLTAALQYVAEASRLGWQSGSPPREAFGWCDVRTGLAGPCDQDGMPLFAGDRTTGIGPAFPAVDGRAARCPMFVHHRPPYAVSPRAVLNPVPREPTRPWAELISYAKPFPEPADPARFALDDPRPEPGTDSRAWFRVRRVGKGAEHRLATFVITCGAGATRGYRDWAEVVADGAVAVFGDSDAFAELRRGESIQWYETEWTSAVGGNTMYYAQANPTAGGGAHRDTYVLNKLGSPERWGRDATNSRQQAGCFLYISRLADPPSDW
jgi:hypothetical protein